MKNAVIRQQVIKWELILCAVMCAIVAFCALPGNIINADAKTETVEYVDREWKDGKIVEPQKSQECTVLTKKICKNDLEGGSTPETAKWFVLNEDITVSFSYIYIYTWLCKYYFERWMYPL